VAAYGLVLSSGAWLGRVGLRPDALTYLSLAFAILAAGAAAYGYFALAALLVVTSGLCDMLDGVVARVTGRVSAYGALLDSTVDRLADALPLLGVAAFYADSGKAVLIPAIAMVGGFAISYVRARAEGLGIALPPLFMRRAERAVLLVMTLLLGLVPISPEVSGIALEAPLLLLGVAITGVLNLVGMVIALRSAQRVVSHVPPQDEHETELPSA
jgi:CDP-diacylglycerol--glycerol-3-phosphate 3-phosphatidyltransferase